ncbi:MAG: DUF72 domain-containing protein [Proteobacteria bacterium]|nr:DUF72 domain-containing protein [Pseudomonadota bacterium]
MEILIGTSGWAYPHWRGRFYPAGLPPSQWLSFFAHTFATVEINRSFYRLPSADNFTAWRQQTPSGFVFSMKAGRFVTHMKKLAAPEDTLPPLLDAAQALQDRAGPILFQLPPRWHVDLARLRTFLDALPRDRSYAFELRDPSWHIAPVRDLLAAHNAAFCVFDLGGVRSPRIVTADFTYVRLHGPGAPYCGEYAAAGLAPWAQWLRGLALRRAFVYFDNDEAGGAVRDALVLREMLAGSDACSPRQ